MIQNAKSKILILTVKWGHLSIAKAIENNLEKDYFVKTKLIDVEKISNLSYTTTYRLFPNLWAIPFKLSEQENIRKFASKFLNNAYYKTLNECVEEFKPDIIINVYFAFIPSLEQLKKRYKFLFINAITNPRTFSKIEVSPEAFNLTFDKKARNLCYSYKITREKIVDTGWFIRKEFRLRENNSLSKQLNLKKDVLTLCVVGGSEGTYNITKILTAFIKNPKPVQVIFICGNNNNLFKAVSTFSKLIDKFNNKLKIIPLGYVNDIYRYLQISDLVIGKAGPNLLFETVATKTPFFAISHIAGQEDGNLEIIKKYKLGFVEENQVKAIKLTRKIIENPKILKRFEKNVSNMAEYNKKAGDVLNEFITVSRTPHPSGRG